MHEYYVIELSDINYARWKGMINWFRIQANKEREKDTAQMIVMDAFKKRKNWL